MEGSNMSPRMAIDYNLIDQFCRKWKMTEFSLFGSILRDNFGPDSDVDVMVSFEPGAHWSLLDLVEMREELQGIFQRPVDLLTRRAVERSQNWIRREAILNHAEMIYGQR
jgi:predicted nucleotidyltransferase